MRSILAGPSLIRQLPRPAAAAAAASQVWRPSGARHASLLQVPSDRSDDGVRATASAASAAAKRQAQAASALANGGKAGQLGAPMFRRQRRALEKKAKKEQAAKRKIAKSPLARVGLEEKKLAPYVRKDHQFKTFKPITPSLRWVRYSIQSHLYRGGPLRVLTQAKRSTGGRNHHGHVVVRGRGGGHRRRIRLVDFHRWETGPQTIQRIEYDPGRSAHIALIEHNVTKIKSYILAPEGLREGDSVQSYRLDKEAIEQGTGQSGSALDTGMFRTRAIRPGNVLPLRLIPIGTIVHALSLDHKGKAKLVRSAGSYGQLVAFVHKKVSAVKAAANAEDEPTSAAPSATDALSSLSLGESKDEGPSPGSQPSNADAQGGAMSKFAQVKLQSGEVRLIRSDCCATIGRVSNVDHRHERVGKAGRSRWMGRRPKVRGVAMNAVDHPHGGGRGKSKSNKHPRSIYGWKTKGPRTRKPGTRRGNQMVIRERPRGVDKMRA